MHFSTDSELCSVSPAGQTFRVSVPVAFRTHRWQTSHAAWCYCSRNCGVHTCCPVWPTLDLCGSLVWLYNKVPRGGSPLNPHSILSNIQAKKIIYLWKPGLAFIVQEWSVSNLIQFVNLQDLTNFVCAWRMYNFVCNLNKFENKRSETACAWHSLANMAYLSFGSVFTFQNLHWPIYFSLVDSRSLKMDG